MILPSAKRTTISIAAFLTMCGVPGHGIAQHSASVEGSWVAKTTRHLLKGKITPERMEKEAGLEAEKKIPGALPNSLIVLFKHARLGTATLSMPNELQSNLNIQLPAGGSCVSAADVFGEFGVNFKPSAILGGNPGPYAPAEHRSFAGGPEYDLEEGPFKSKVVFAFIGHQCATAISISQTENL